MPGKLRYFLGIACEMNDIFGARAYPKDLYNVLLFLAAAHGTGIGDQKTA